MFKLGWLTGGSLAEFFQRTVQHMRLFQTHTPNIIVVMDGLRTDAKQRTAAMRYETIGFRSVEAKRVCARKEYQRAAEQQLQGRSIPPLLLMQMMMQACHCAGVSVRVSTREADGDIARLALELNGVIISNDSDFWVFDVPAFAPFWTLQLSGQC